MSISYCTVWSSLKDSGSLSSALLSQPAMELKSGFKILIVLRLVFSIHGHGRMIDPPSRNSAWRYGFPNPPHYTDNELNCGGFNVQWKTNGGKCGVCGDPYHEKNQPHIYPGKYANGIITKTYREGQEIEVLIEITSNHMGTFFFKIGELDTEPITEEKLVYLLKQPNGQDYWKLPKGKGCQKPSFLSIETGVVVVFSHLDDRRQQARTLGVAQTSVARLQSRGCKILRLFTNPFGAKHNSNFLNPYSFLINSRKFASLSLNSCFSSHLALNKIEK